MVQKANVRKPIGRRIKDLQDTNQQQYGLIRRRFSAPQTIGIPSGAGAIGTSPVSGNFLRIEGDSMIGPIAFFPRVYQIVSGTPDEIIISAGTNAFSTYVIVTGEGLADDDVDTITGAAFSGQVFYLQANTVSQLTLKHGTVNILTPDANDFVIPAGNIAILIFDPTVAGGAWRVIGLAATGGTGDFANRALSNLTNPTSVNQDLVPQANLDLGTAISTWQKVHTRIVEFPLIASPTSNLTQIYSDANADININFRSGSEIKFREQGIEKHSLTASTFSVLNIILGDGTADVGRLSFNDLTAATAPSNGQMYREGSDVKCFSGGAERSLTDIGAAAGANTELSNLISPTTLNFGLIPQANLDLGTSADQWQKIFVENVELTGTASTGSTLMQIYRDTNDDMNFNIPLTNTFFWKVGGVAEMILSDTGSLTSLTNVSTDQLTLDVNPVAPAINGVMASDGTDIRGFSGGSLVNLSNLATDTLNNLGTTSINADLIPQANIDLGTSGNQFQKLFVENVELTGIASTGTTLMQIYRDTNSDMNFNVPATTDLYQWRFAGGVGATLNESGGSTRFDVDRLEANLDLQFQNALSDPAVNGNMRMNGSDVKVFTGGVLKNLTNIGTGASVTLPLSVNVDTRGTVSGTQILDLSLVTAHYHTMTLSGDADFTFINPPADGLELQFTLDITQDGIGGRSITFNDTLETSAVDVKKGIGERTIIIVSTRDATPREYSTFGSALTPSVSDVGDKWSDPVDSSIVPTGNPSVFSIGTGSSPFLNGHFTGTLSVPFIASTSSDLTITGHLVPFSDGSQNLGTSIFGGRWQDLFLSGQVSCFDINIQDTNSQVINTGPNWIRFTDMASGSVTTPLSVATSNLFLDTSTGEISVKKFGGGTVSLEGAGAGGDNWGDPVDANIIPDLTTNNRDLGSATNQFNRAWFDNIVEIGALVMSGAITLGGAIFGEGFAFTDTGSLFPQVNGVPSIGSDAPGTGQWYDDVFTETLSFRGAGGDTTQTKRSIYATGSRMVFQQPFASDGYEFRDGPDIAHRLNAQGGHSFYNNQGVGTESFRITAGSSAQSPSANFTSLQCLDDGELKLSAAGGTGQLRLLRDFTGVQISEGANNHLKLGNSVEIQWASGEKIERNLNNLTYTAATTHFFVIGSSTEMQVRNGSVRIDGGGDFRSDSATEIGFKVTNDTFSTGSEGTMQIPRSTLVSPADATLDVLFGSGDGAMGLSGANEAFPKLHVKSNGNWSHANLANSN